MAPQNLPLYVGSRQPLRLSNLGGLVFSAGVRSCTQFASDLDLQIVVTEEDGSVAFGLSSGGGCSGLSLSSIVSEAFGALLLLVTTGICVGRLLPAVNGMTGFLSGEGLNNVGDEFDAIKVAAKLTKRVAGSGLGLGPRGSSNGPLSSNGVAGPRSDKDDLEDDDVQLDEKQAWRMGFFLMD